jgi:hypothetical protein
MVHREKDNDHQMHGIIDRHFIHNTPTNVDYQIHNGLQLDEENVR